MSWHAFVQWRTANRAKVCKLLARLEAALESEDAEAVEAAVRKFVYELETAGGMDEFAYDSLERLSTSTVWEYVWQPYSEAVKSILANYKVQDMFYNKNLVYGINWAIVWWDTVKNATPGHEAEVWMEVGRHAQETLNSDVTTNERVMIETIKEMAGTSLRATRQAECSTRRVFEA